VAGGVAATAILVLCCIVFVAVYLHKRKQPAPNVDKTRYDLNRLELNYTTMKYNHYLDNRMLPISLFYSDVTCK